MIFKGTTKELHELFTQINKIHPTINFTMQHTSLKNEKSEDKCDCPELNSIPFLDTACSIENRKIMLDLYKKKVI